MSIRLVAATVMGLACLILGGCASLPEGQDSSAPRVAHARPTPMDFPQEAADLIEEAIRQPTERKIAFAVFDHDGTDYRLAAEAIAAELRAAFQDRTGVKTVAMLDLLSDEDRARWRSLSAQSSRLDFLAQKSGCHGMVRIDVKTIRFSGASDERFNSLSPGSVRTEERGCEVTARIVATEYFLRRPTIDLQIVGQSRSSLISKDGNSSLITIASNEAAQKFTPAMLDLSLPPREIVEVRGGGRFVKIGPGATGSVETTSIMQIYRLAGVKGPDGTVVAVEPRVVGTVPVIELEGASFWCDGSLSPGAFKVGQLAVVSDVKGTRTSTTRNITLGTK